MPSVGQNKTKIAFFAKSVSFGNTQKSAKLYLSTCTFYPLQLCSEETVIALLIIEDFSTQISSIYDSCDKRNFST